MSGVFAGYELGDVVNFLVCFAIHRRNEGVVTVVSISLIESL